MIMSYYAHTPTPDSEDWQLLEDHLKNTAKLAAGFAGLFASREIGYNLGMLHDIGKVSDEFQSYLKKCHIASQQGDKPPVGKHDHKLAGAICAKELGAHYESLAFPLLGHHGGMQNRADVQSRTSDPNELKRISLALQRASEFLPSILKYQPFPSQFISSNQTLEMYLRMLYSCLVDADYLDTESHWEPDKNRNRENTTSLADLWNCFQTNQSKLTERVIDTKVNQVRCKIYDSCLDSAESAPGVFKLTVPTGGGKTRSGMAFALKHAVAHGMRRVVVAIPYTSIIDQNAKEYQEILGKHNVLEHHSAITPPDSDQYSEELLKMELAAENWDVPVVVTTTVQLFESMFSNKPSKCRKLHNLAGSVIILDEVQTLPLGLLQPIIYILNELVENYGVTLILSTATQPALSGSSPYLDGFPECTEIVPDPKQYFDILKRVDYQVEQEPWSWERIAEEIRGREQVLCVLNSRKDAVMLLKMLDSSDTLHLSTLMCPAHRRKVLDDIRRRLDNNEPCRVVSTQVVEAGVDLDFPCVMRAAGPLDRIVQAAGRCNREGRMDGMGEVIVFEPEEGRAPKGSYATAMDNAKRMLKNQNCDLHDPEVFDKYFRTLWQDCNLDSEKICDLQKHIKYLDVACRFKMIDSETVPIITSYGGQAVTDLLDQAQWKGVLARDEWRTLQSYSVNVYKYDFDRYRNQKLVSELLPGLYKWQGTYNDDYGLSDDLPDPADLIA